MASEIAKVASDNPSSLAAPQPIPSLPKEKRQRSDTAEATLARKRQKAKEVIKDEVQTALGQLSLAWKAKADAAAAWRLQAQSEPGSTLELLIKGWNMIRAADGRPALTGAQISLIPQDQQLHSLLSDVFMSPLTWEAADFPTILERRDVLEEAASNKVQYYIRRLKFENRDQLSSFLEKVRAITPQYAGQIDNLLTASKSLLGSFFVSYGGITVSNSPVGRDLDDKESTKHDGSASFLKTVLENYEGTRLVYEVVPLAFEIGTGGRDSVKLSRIDSRTGLFESLVIDSMGVLCFNTAPPGTVIELEATAKFIAMRTALQNSRTATRKSHQPFKWQIPAAGSSSA